MIIVGISGGIEHGKTTLANYLAEHSAAAGHWESSDLIIDVANALRAAGPPHADAQNLSSINRWLEPLPAILEQQLHAEVSLQQIALTPERVKETPLNYDKLFDYLSLTANRPDLQRNTINVANKSEFRNILQWLGGYLVKTVNDGIWFDEIVRRIRATDNLELATVGGLRFPGDGQRIHQAGGSIVQIKRPGIGESHIQDLTERERDLILPDITIINDGSLEQLHTCAGLIFDDLKQHNQPLNSAYVASTLIS